MSRTLGPRYPSQGLANIDDPDEAKAWSAPDATPDSRPNSRPVSLADVDVSAGVTRIATGMAALDAVLGGGLVPGSMIVIGGGPGMGKSTLLMQLLQHVNLPGIRLYASGEESETQVAMTASRIGAADPRIRIVHESCVENILWHARELRAEILVVDSMHVASSRDSRGLSGGDHQVKATGQMIMKFAKSTGITTIAICHVNKEDGISGPKKLEHLGDTTLMLEEHDLLGNPYRVLKVLKNRHGSELVVGMLEMTEHGLISVSEEDAAQTQRARPSGDDLAPIAQELLYQVIELGGKIDDGLRDRIAGRLDMAPRGGR